MSKALKWSPLCSRDEGREIYFTAKVNDRKMSVVFPSDALDQSCGAQSTEKARKQWVNAQKPKLVGTLTASQPLPDDLSNILIEEISNAH